VDAWVALGGEADKSGLLDVDKLIKIVKDDFAMTIDIAKLVKELDTNQDGKVDYSVRTHITSCSHTPSILLPPRHAHRVVSMLCSAVLCCWCLPAGVCCSFLMRERAGDG